ncbi:MAG: hypothetical protein AABY65_05905, partial [Nitrospirota bacterium]
ERPERPELLVQSVIAQFGNVPERLPRAPSPSASNVPERLLWLERFGWASRTALDGSGWMRPCDLTAGGRDAMVSRMIPVRWETGTADALLFLF